MDTQDFIDLADELSGRSEESAFRTAINRYYYGCHLEGIRNLSTIPGGKGWFPWVGGGKDHVGLIKGLRDNNYPQLSVDLSNLYTLREHADYHLVGDEGEKCHYCDAPPEGSDPGDAAAVIGDDVDQAREYVNELWTFLRANRR